MHTDWLSYCRDSLKFHHESLDRVRRLMRFIYRQFDHILTLNKEDKSTLTGHKFEISEKHISVVSHWYEQDTFHPRIQGRNKAFPNISPDTIVLLFVGRLSPEKGTNELIALMDALNDLPVQLVIIGDGPEKNRLEQAMPEAQLLGWQSQHQLAQFYSGADILLFPSRFDTFGRVLVEGMASGLASVAYDCKGPADIVQHDFNGYLAQNAEEFIHYTRQLIENPETLASFRKAAAAAMRRYQKDQVIEKLIEAIGIHNPIEFTQDMLMSLLSTTSEGSL